MAKSDTVAGQVAAFNAEEVEVPPCVRIRPQDRPFLAVILPARAREEWDGPSLVAAGQLARCMADIEDHQMTLDEDGPTQVNDKGTQIANPMFAVVESLTRRSMALQRALQIAPIQQGKQAGKVTGKRETGKAVKAARESVKDDLIPGLH